VTLEHRYRESGKDEENLVAAIRGQGKSRAAQAWVEMSPRPLAQGRIRRGVPLNVVDGFEVVERR